MRRVSAPGGPPRLRQRREAAYLGAYNHARAGERYKPHSERSMHRQPRELAVDSNLIWIIIVVLVVLALLGYFGRGRFRG